MPIAWVLVGCGEPERDARSTPSPPGDHSSTPPDSAPPPADCPAIDAFTEVPGPLLLERALTLSLAAPEAGWVACTSPDDPLERHLLESDGASTTHAFALRGLLPETSYTCVAHSACGGEPAEVSFTTDRPEGLPALTVTTTAGETPWGAYTLFNEQRGCLPTSAMYLAIADTDGRLRWVYDVGDALVLDLDAALVDRDRIHLGGGWGTFDLAQPNRGVFRDIDLSGRTLLERTEPAFGLGFNHHSERLPDGSTLSITGDRDTDGVTEWNGVGVEQWSESEGLIWSWDSRALALAGALDPPGFLGFLPGPYHANAAAFVTDALGDAMWLSIYGTEELWRVDRATGERTHVFGAGGDFALVDVSGAPLPDREFPWVQHGPDYGPDGHVLLYDNGVTRPGGGTSRVAEYRLDLSANEATLLWSWTEPGWSEVVVGDADYLPNGNVLVTQGFSVCAEVLPNDVNELVELRPPDTVVSRTTWPDSTWGSYRAERYDGCALFSNARFCPALADRWDALGAP